MDSVLVLKNAPNIGNIEIGTDAANSISLEEFIPGEKLVLLTNPTNNAFIYKFDTINNVFNNVERLCTVDPTKQRMLTIPDTNEEMTESCVFDRLLDGFKIEVGTAFIKNPIYDEIMSENFLTNHLLYPHTFTKEELNFIDGNGNTILHLIVNSDTNDKYSNIVMKLETILEAKQVKPDLLNKVNNDGKTVLDLAVQKYGLNKDNIILSYLIKKGGEYAPKPKKGLLQLFNFGGRRTGKNIKTKRTKKTRRTKRKNRRT